MNFRVSPLWWSVLAVASSIAIPWLLIKNRSFQRNCIQPDVVNAQPGWWFPEDAPPEYGWKKSSVNLLLGQTEYDPDNGAESLRSALCKVYPDGTGFGGS